MLYLTNTCMPTNIRILQRELFPITSLGGGGETLPYSKFRHIYWEHMMTEHQGLSVIVLIFVKSC